MIGLRQALEDYLRIRRRLGFELKATERQLERFVCFLEQAGAVRITTELALMWARLPVDAHPHQWSKRLGVVRGFARYLATIDPDSPRSPSAPYRAIRRRRQSVPVACQDRSETTIAGSRSTAFARTSSAGASLACSRLLARKHVSE